MKTKDLLSLSFTGVLVLCTLVITGLVIRREFFPPETQLEVRQIKNWQQLELQGPRTGPAEAPVQIVEFFDYQCPFCKSVQPVVQAIQQKYIGQVSVTHEHFPLASHEHAFQAAVAAECAARQKRFSEYHDLLFAHQGQLGQLPYDSLAAKAAVPNIQTFTTCVENRQTVPIVNSGLDLAKELSLNSVPSFMINGKLVSGALPQHELERLVEEALAE